MDNKTFITRRLPNVLALSVAFGAISLPTLSAIANINPVNGVCRGCAWNPYDGRLTRVSSFECPNYDKCCYFWLPDDNTNPGGPGEIVTACKRPNGDGCPPPYTGLQPCPQPIEL